MSALMVEGLSSATIERLARRAAVKNRTVAEEVREVLEEAMAKAPERLPMYVPSSEVSAPFDLPYESVGIPVKSVDGGKRWPDRPITDEDIR
jgi:plasmid stability protein